MVLKQVAVELASSRQMVPVGQASKLCLKGVNTVFLYDERQMEV
jgi:hypothetical protein